MFLANTKNTIPPLGNSRASFDFSKDNNRVAKQGECK